jgi:hypothetical protein
MSVEEKQPITVFLLNYYYDPDIPDGESLLKRYHTLPGWAEALQQAGLRTSVFQRFHCDEIYINQGVRYQLVYDRLSARLKKWQVPFRLHRLLKTSCEQCLAQGGIPVLHVNGLLFPLQTRHLRSTLPALCVLALQHHAEQPAPGWGKCSTWGLAGVDGFLFAARDLAQPWLERGVIRSTQDVFEVMEGSTHFDWQDRLASRSLTGLQGNPLFLWVGRLNANKDPLVRWVRMVYNIIRRRLYMIYHAGVARVDQAKLSANLAWATP